ncbi:hypothetical protein BKA81DRAFT_18736 [Phyllosticta paracitricarpa]
MAELGEHASVSLTFLSPRPTSLSFHANQVQLPGHTTSQRNGLTLRVPFSPLPQSPLRGHHGIRTENTYRENRRSKSATDTATSSCSQSSVPEPPTMHLFPMRTHALVEREISQSNVCATLCQNSRCGQKRDKKQKRCKFECPTSQTFPNATSSHLSHVT